MNAKNYSKMWKYTGVWLKVETKNCDRKFLMDQKMRKKSFRTKNEILKNYKDYLFNPKNKMK
jgi:hypothetical protein